MRVAVQGQESRELGFEELVERLQRAVSAAEHRKQEHAMATRMLLNTVHQLLAELGCEKLTINNIEFRLVRVPADDPDPQCVYYAIADHGMSEAEATERCVEYEESIAATGLDGLSASQLDRIRVKLANILRAVRLVKHAEELASYMSEANLALAADVKERVEEFKQRYCTG